MVSVSKTAVCSLSFWVVCFHPGVHDDTRTGFLFGQHAIRPAVCTTILAPLECIVRAITSEGAPVNIGHETHRLSLSIHVSMSPTDFKPASALPQNTSSLFIKGFH